MTEQEVALHMLFCIVTPLEEYLYEMLPNILFLTCTQFSETSGSLGQVQLVEQEREQMLVLTLIAAIHVLLVFPAFISADTEHELVSLA